MNSKPRYRVVPDMAGSLAPSRAFADADAAREWANLMACRDGRRMSRGESAHPVGPASVCGHCWVLAIMYLCS